MKKTLLLAGVACLFSVSANAMDLSREFRPYIGLDYVYSHADYKDMVREPKKSYNSGAVNVGTWIIRQLGSFLPAVGQDQGL